MEGWVRTHILKTDDLRIVIRQNGFAVKVLAAHLGLSVRTFERHFREQFRMTPKAWIMRERMSLAPPLLADGLSNKQVAAFLSYNYESNFCRDFKRCFGCAPQKLARNFQSVPLLSYSDKESSGFDKRAELPWTKAARILKSRSLQLKESIQ